ncbi:hypothetical protein ES705_34778 [subsurface metagenome]
MAAGKNTIFATRIERRSATRARSNGVRQSGGRFSPSSFLLSPAFLFFKPYRIQPVTRTLVFALVFYLPIALKAFNSGALAPFQFWL